MSGQTAVLYLQTSDDPERQYAPLVLAQAAVAMGLKPTLFYTGQGLKIVVAGAAENIQVGDYPNLARMLEDTMALGVPVYVCEASRQLYGWESVEIREGVTIAGAATLNDLALDAGATMCF